MARSVAKDPVVTRTGNDKFLSPPVVRTTDQAIDPRCRYRTGDQNVVLEVAQ